MSVIRIMTKEENLKKAIHLHDHLCLNIPLSERTNMFNDALQLVIDANEDVFESEKMTTATYSGCVENTDIRDLAIKKYESMTGLKASTRRLYDLAIKLYLEMFKRTNSWQNRS